MALGTQTILANQTPWEPPADWDNSQPIQIEAWGRGGNGGNGSVNGGGGGGGGGYAKWSSVPISDPSEIGSITITPNVSIGISNEWLDGVLVCNNGQNGENIGTAGSGGNGGDGSDIEPDVSFKGGTGGSNTGPQGGGGGGGSASTNGNGEVGAGNSGDTGGAGGSGAPDGGGDGGAGGTGDQPGVNGSFPGGGGGGAGVSGGSGGTGGAGQVIITYTILESPGSAVVAAHIIPWLRRRRYRTLFLPLLITNILSCLWAVKEILT